MNPFVLSRLELHSPRPLERVLESLDALLRDGVDHEGRHYRLFGSRRGRYFSMSLGMPVLGGTSPVLRAWLGADAGTPRFHVQVGARLELMLFGGFWLALTVVGGGYQLLLQLLAMAAGRATLDDVWAVLPGIGIMAAIVGFALWYFRSRGGREGEFLVDSFRYAIGAVPEHGATSAHARTA